MALIAGQVKTNARLLHPLRQSPFSLVLVASILLVAMGLRACRIAAQSLWYDEGVSAVMAPRGLVDITVSSAADIHPPLYYYLLHFWTGLTGTSELALRWLSLIAGVLLVASVYSLARRLANRNVAVFAAGFAALSPLLVYYSQEARMYAQVALLGALSFRLFIPVVEWLRGETGRAEAPARTFGQNTITGRLTTKSTLVYLLVSIAMLYSHYYAFTVLLAQNLLAVAFCVAGLFSPKRRPQAIDGRSPRAAAVRRFGIWVGLQATLVVLYLPWLIVSFGQLQSWPSISDAFGLRTLLEKVFVAFSFGLAADAAVTPARSIVFLALLAALALTPLAGDRRRNPSTLLVFVYAAVPVLAMYALSLRRPMYNPKFLLLAVPAYALLLGFGLDTLRAVGVRVLNDGWKAVRSYLAATRGTAGERRSPLPFKSAQSAASRYLSLVWSAVVVVGVFLLVLYPTGWSLAATYFDSKYARDDYRSLVASIVSRAGPDDAIVLNAPGQVDIFGYYYRGELPVYALPRQRPPDASATRDDLQSIADRHNRIWLVLWAAHESDPDGIVERWLDQNAFKVDNRWFGGPRLCEYALSAGEATTETAGVAFQDGVRLQNFAILNPLVEAGQPLNLSLTWLAERKVEGRYAVFVHIIDDKEYLWGQMDSEPVGGGVPTNTWRAGAEIVDKRGVQVLQGTPPGKYRLELGLYRPDSGERLQLLDGGGSPVADRYLFGSLEVVPPKSPPAIESLKIARALAATFGGSVKLAGFGLNPLGRDSDGPIFSPQDIAQLTLIWQAQVRPAADLSVRLAIRDKSGQEVAGVTQPITDGRYPTSRWGEGEIVRDQMKVPLNGLAAGEYAVSLTVIDAAGNPLSASLAGSSGAGSIQLGLMTMR